jgi:poly(hydroxyalkanoate) granule-associated protein
MPAREVTELPADVIAAAQKVWFAGLGAVTFAQEEGGKLFASLVAIGEQVEKELRKSVPSPAAAVRGATTGAEDVWRKVQGLFDAQVTATLHRLGVPTKDEIAQLTKRIEALTASIEALKYRR